MEQNLLIAEDEATVAFADLPIFEASADAAIEADVLAGAIAELRERLLGGSLDFESRIDIAADLRDSAERLLAFALTVRS